LPRRHQKIESLVEFYSTKTVDIKITLRYFIGEIPYFLKSTISINNCKSSRLIKLVVDSTDTVNSKIDNEAQLKALFAALGL
jgi:hypothetical protein